MLAATGVISMSVPIVVTVSWLERHGRLGAAGRRVGLQTWGRRLAASCSVGAATVHLAVIPEHAAAYLPAGFFFAGLAGFQLACAFGVLRRPILGLLLHPNRPPLWSAAWGGLGHAAGTSRRTPFARYSHGPWWGGVGCVRRGSQSPRAQC